MSREVKAHVAAEYYNVSESTVRKLAREGKIETKKTSTGRYIYILPTEKAKCLNTTEDKWSENIIYARVSSRGQRDELNQQSNSLQSRFPNYTLVRDFGSGIDYKRRGFSTILERLIAGNVKRVVVTSSDRFSRFGFDFFQWMFSKFNAVLEAVEESDGTGGEDDMVGDIMEIFASFTAKRKHGSKNSKGKILSDSDTESSDE